jgi:biotin transport system substrate-specific component
MKTRQLILCAFFAALTIIGTILSIPLPFSPVPINLALLSVFLSGGLLGAKAGALSQGVYVLLGLIGLPVFSKFAGGPGVLAGPTGGYIIGYIASAFVIGLITQRSGKPELLQIIIAITLGLLACYIPGTLWFMNITESSLLPALTMCIFPFLPGDAIKILLSALLIKRLKRFLD